MQQFGIAAELGRAEDLDLRLVAQVCVGAAGELVGARLEQRAGLANVAELQAETLRRRGAGEQPRYGNGTHKTEHSHKRKSTRLNSSHSCAARMPASACKTKTEHTTA